MVTKILLIDNYDSFTYNLYHYVSFFDKNVVVRRNNKVNTKDIIKNKYKKIIISPGPGNPNQAGNCLKIVGQFYKKIPILGVCLGHQIIGQVFGSKIIQAKKLMHGKTSLIKNKKIGILKGIKSQFTATRYHSLIVDRTTLSKELRVTATTDENTIMGLMHYKYQIHGVQFHPESINTKVGMKIIENFVKI